MGDKGFRPLASQVILSYPLHPKMRLGKIAFREVSRNRWLGFRKPSGTTSRASRVAATSEKRTTAPARPVTSGSSFADSSPWADPIPLLHDFAQNRGLLHKVLASQLAVQTILLVRGVTLLTPSPRPDTHIVSVRGARATLRLEPISRPPKLKKDPSTHKTRERGRKIHLS